VKEDAIRKDLGRVLLKLEELQDEAIKKALEPQKAEIALTEVDQKEALELLRDPKLLDRILEDFTRCGVVGEETNKLVGYLAAVSRHLEAPLAVVVQSSTAAGKSSLMDAVLAFVPEEERIQYSAMTGQSLYYMMGEMDLKHKVLAVVEEEGASRAASALKLLQSEGALSIASTGKDPSTGKLVTHQYRVEGPVMILLTATAIDLDEELLNRCLVLSVNEDREQTQAIHKLQREQQTLEGLLKRQERTTILKRHQNAQRLLKPLFGPIRTPKNSRFRTA
jgi:DNA primase